MTRLQRYIQSSPLSECDVMNLLQDHGIISDLCVDVVDVAAADQRAALQFLLKHIPETTA